MGVLANLTLACSRIWECSQTWACKDLACRSKTKTLEIFSSSTDSDLNAAFSYWSSLTFPLLPSSRSQIDPAPVFGFGGEFLPEVLHDHLIVATRFFFFGFSSSSASEELVDVFGAEPAILARGWSGCCWVRLNPGEARIRVASEFFLFLSEKPKKAKKEKKEKKTLKEAPKAQRELIKRLRLQWQTISSTSSRLLLQTGRPLG